MRRRVARSILGLFAAAAAAIACRGAGSDEAAVRALVGKEAEAWTARDLKALSEIWAQDQGILLFDVAPPGRYEGWEAIGRQLRDFLAQFSEIRVEVEGVRVEVEGPIGWASWNWSLRGRMGNDSVEDRGVATAVYRREKAGWRLVHEHYSVLPAAGAAPKATPAGVAPAGAMPSGPASTTTPTAR